MQKTKPDNQRAATLGYYPLFVSLSFYLIGHFLWGYPSDPDVLFTFGQELGVFLIFLFWVVCVLSWGRFLSARILVGSREEAFNHVALGTAWAAGTVALFGHLADLTRLGLLSFDFRHLWNSLLFFGPLLLAIRKDAPAAVANSAQGKEGENWKFRAGLAICLLVVASRVLKGFLIHGTSDPFIYHLVGPRAWAEAGRIYQPSGLIYVFQCSYWEYILTWGQLLLGGAAGRGLIEGQLFGQWIHSLLGVGGCMLAVFSISRRLKLSLGWAILCVVAGVTSVHLFDYSWLAKNDWGTCFWLLSGVSFVFSGQSRRRDLILGGFFTGMAVAAKLNMVFSAVLLVLAFFVSGAHFYGLRSTSKRTAWIISAILLGALPIWIRNWLGTGNPLYPFGDGIFSPSSFGPTMQEFFGLHPAKLNLDAGFILKRVQEVSSDKLFLASWISVPLLMLMSRGPRKLFWFWIFMTASGAWYFVMELVNPFPRWLGATLILVPALLIGAVHASLSARDSLLVRSVWWILFLIFGARAVAWSSWKVMDDWISPAYVIRDASIVDAGDSKAWLRLNAGGEVIATTGDNQTYYISALRPLVITEDPVIDALTYFSQGPLELVRRLRSRGVRYVLDTRYFDGRYWSKAAYILDEGVRLHPESVVFEGRGSKVVDLERLEASIEKACDGELYL